jgi:hemerythrin-like domain-containing protein
MKQLKNPDVITLLKEDHKLVKKLLKELEDTTTRGVKSRRQLLSRIAEEVRLHAHVEETIFYPAFRDAAARSEDERLFLEASEEHRLVHEMLPELERTDPSTEMFSARAKVLKDLIEHHAEEEEREMLPRAKKLLSTEERTALGQETEERKLAVKREGLPLETSRRSRNGRSAGSH